MQVDPEILARVRANFVKKQKLILDHHKPWTPWALTYLLDIDDSETAIPAELILYKALKASRKNRTDVQNVTVQVNYN